MFACEINILLFEIKMLEIWTFDVGNNVIFFDYNVDFGVKKSFW